MSYKDTEERLRRALNGLKSSKSEFFIEKTVFEKRCAESMNRMQELLKKLDTGNWRFVAKSLDNSYVFAEVYYLSDEAICTDSVRYDTLSAPIGFSLENARRSNSSGKIKQNIVAGMLDCISRSRILRLDLLADTVLKPAELAEHKITSDMCDEIYDMIDESDNARVDLYDSWYTTDLAEDVDKIEDIIEQAAQEWFKEGNLKPGMLLDCYPDPLKITSTTSNSVTVEGGKTYQFGGRFELGGSARSPLARTWKNYHPDLKIDDTLYPFDDTNI